MKAETLESYLKMVGMNHTILGEFWADLMNKTKCKIIGWLLENGIKDMKELSQYLRPNQIASMRFE